jgi:hypothetical protein
VKRLLFSKVSFTLLAIAIFLIGMFHDPDAANGDDLPAGPVVHERMPGYQMTPNAGKSHPLSEADLAALNTPTDGAVPTF